jgi:hypothetical protein
MVSWAMRAMTNRNESRRSWKPFLDVFRRGSEEEGKGAMSRGVSIVVDCWIVCNDGNESVCILSSY